MSRRLMTLGATAYLVLATMWLSNLGAAACRTLSPEEASVLIGGIDSRECGPASQCKAVKTCTANAVKADCEDSEKNWKETAEPDAKGQDCSVISAKACDDSGAQEDCLKKWMCEISPINGGCVVTDSVFGFNRAPAECKPATPKEVDP